MRAQERQLTVHGIQNAESEVLLDCDNESPPGYEIIA